MPRQHLDDQFRLDANHQLEELDEQLAEVRASIREHEEEQRLLLTEINVLRTLLAIDDGQHPGEEPQSGVVGDPRETAVEILREYRGQEVHYRILAAEVQRRGGHLPPRDPPAALNAIMNRDRRFVRPTRRGYYALREDYPQVQESIGQRNSRRRSTGQQ